MSVENVNKFKKELVENKELREKALKELESFKDSGKKEKELIPEIARKLGYDFTDEEFKEANKTLSDEELANVSGGVLWFDDDAPDGHELSCIKYYYWGWSNYYFENGICENCKSKEVDVGRTNGEKGVLICSKCKHITPKYGFMNWFQ